MAWTRDGSRKGGLSNKGKQKSKQVKEKISSTLKNKPRETTLSERIGEKIRKIHSGKKRSLETKRRLSENKRKYWQSISNEKKKEQLKSFENKKFENTKPELIFERLLSDKNIRYEKQKWIRGYRVDFYLPDHNMIVEIQGCYWHACDQCGFSQKIDARMQDQMRKENLEALGYKVKFIWEHELSDGNS